MNNEINLNSILFDERITKDGLLKLVSQEDIYSHYIGENISNLSLMNSPFRNDTIPSFSLYYHKTERHTLMFHDFATKESGDVIVFVMRLFQTTYENALFKIAYDFKLSNFDIDAVKHHVEHFEKLKEKKSVNIGINKREWFKHDQDFWSQFAIRKSTLERFRVSPIKFIFYNGNAVKAEPLAYAYEEWKDAQLSYKIYQPESPNKKFKWVNNANYTVHQGYTQLPPTGELLIITKSLKDVMSMWDTMGLFSIGLQSESVTMKESVMDEYKSRFNKVVCLFDNDKAGVELSKVFSEKYDIPHFFIPQLPNVTDYSDLVKYGGVETAGSIFNEQLNKIL